MGRIVKFLFGSLSIIIALIAIGIGYLKFDDVYRQKGELIFNYFIKNFLNIIS